MTHHIVAKNLILIGALNWGVVGATMFLENHFGIGNRFDVIEYLGINLLNIPILVSLVYILIGVAAIIIGLSMFNRSM